MKLFAWLIIASVISTIGDFACKYGAVHQDREVLTVIVATVCWSICAVLWVGFYRSKSVTELTIVYTPIHAVMMMFIGIVVYQDAVTWKTLLAGALASASVWLLL